MTTAIVGLASSGKTTLFNALTRTSAPKGSYGEMKSMNMGVGAKPDHRLESLERSFKSRRKVRAEMPFWDMPTDYVSGDMFKGETITSLQRAKAIVAVVRSFGDPAVPHSEGSVDWRRDAQAILFDILFADIELLDRRISRIQDRMKAMKSAERVVAIQNIKALEETQKRLEDGIPVRSAQLEDSARRVVATSFMLSALPLMVALNIDESDADADPETMASDAARELNVEFEDRSFRVVPFCARLEEELRALNDAEAEELRDEMELRFNASETLMDACLASLKTQTFYTASDREVRAWHFPAGCTAPEAAGIVHSDMERGFIRAEVVAFNDYMECESMAEARKRGLLRQEGREYRFADGDIVNFLFSV